MKIKKPVVKRALEMKSSYFKTKKDKLKDRNSKVSKLANLALKEFYRDEEDA